MMEGIREKIRNHSTATIAVMAFVVAGALFFTLRNASSSTTTVINKAYYTIDEGQTTFVGEMASLPPFDHGGKPACRVWMFSCDGGKTKFVGYLERFTPEAQKRAAAATAKSGPGSAQLGPNDSEIKKPGAGNPWVSRANLPEAAKIMQVKCPGGGAGDPEMVMP